MRNDFGDAAQFYFKKSFKMAAKMVDIYYGQNMFWMIDLSSKMIDEGSKWW